MKEVVKEYNLIKFWHQWTDQYNFIFLVLRIFSLQMLLITHSITNAVSARKLKHRTIFCKNDQNHVQASPPLHWHRVSESCEPLAPSPSSHPCTPSLLALSAVNPPVLIFIIQRPWLLLAPTRAIIHLLAHAYYLFLQSCCCLQLLFYWAAVNRFQFYPVTLTIIYYLKVQLYFSLSLKSENYP